MLFGVSLCLPACSHDDSEPQPAAEPDSIELSLIVDVAAPGSNAGARRADTRVTDPDDYELPTYDCEKLHHLRVIIVDESTGMVVHNRGILFNGDVPAADDMRFKLTAETRYRIWLIGNGEQLGYNFVSAYPVGSKFDALSMQNIQLTTTAGSPLYNNSGTSTKQNIPMSETFYVTTPKAKQGGVEITEFTQRLFITRAASKFSFTVSTKPGFESAGSHLTSIKIYGISDREFLFPRNAVYNPSKSLPSTNKYEGREIVKFDVPGESQYADIVYNFPTPINLPISNYAWAPEIYVPETQLPEDGFFLCSLSFDNGQTWLYPLQLPNLPYGLPRNTHVKVNITLGEKNMAIIEVNVLPWEQVINEFDYSEQIGMATDGALDFTAGTYLSLNKSTARLVLDYPNAAVGSFGISSPLGARWDAYLITLSGQQDAILFRKDDGTLTSHLNGIVGKKANFKIEAVNAPGTSANASVLQVTVTMADGRTMQANVLQGGGYGADRDMMTIIQNPQ